MVEAHYLMGIQLVDLIVTVATALGGGAVTGLMAVAAMRTDVKWLIKSVERVEDSVTRAHERIDAIE